MKMNCKKIYKFKLIIIFIICIIVGCTRKEPSLKDISIIFSKIPVVKNEIMNVFIPQINVQIHLNWENPKNSTITYNLHPLKTLSTWKNDDFKKMYLIGNLATNETIETLGQLPRFPFVHEGQYIAMLITNWGQLAELCMCDKVTLLGWTPLLSKFNRANIFLNAAREASSKTAWKWYQRAFKVGTSEIILEEAMNKCIGIQEEQLVKMFESIYKDAAIARQKCKAFKEVYLYDIEPSQVVGLQKIKKGTTYNGKPVIFDKVEYSKSISTHVMPKGECFIEYDLDKKYSLFKCKIAVTHTGDVKFKFDVDGKKLYESDFITSNAPPEKVEIDVENGKKLKITVDKGKYNYGDQALWCNPRLIRRGFK